MTLPFIDRFPITRWAPIPLRVIVGYGFMEHGFAKLAKGPDALANILQAMGVPGPHFMAWSTILVEILGGLAVILGAFVTLASLPMAAVLLVAMFTVQLPYGFSSIKLIAVTATGAHFGPPGFEVNLLYLACLSALVLGGSGPLAIDGLITKQRKVGHDRRRQNSLTGHVEQSGTNAPNCNQNSNKEKIHPESNAPTTILCHSHPQSRD
jgi:putative oxidoreductase